MKILVTGAKGFVGKNLICELRNRGYTDLLEYDLDTDANLLDRYTKECEFVFHLAGVNRPKNPGEFMKGNCEFTAYLLECLKAAGNMSPVLITSSIQAEADNPYGQSKKAGEELIWNHEKQTGAKALIYRLPNVFGKWCRPNYNSAVATFCYNIARDLPIQVNDPSTVMRLVYIDDVVREFIRALEGNENRKALFCDIPKIHVVALGRIVKLLRAFRLSREERAIPNMEDDFTKSLYATYLSYLPEDGFSYPLVMHTDHRGSFTEFIRTPDRGQISVNISKPGITKGNHWHHTKNEKFLVVSGKGVIRFRNVHGGEVLEYFVGGEKLEVVDIPPGYTHNIENLGEADMITVMWASESFDPANPDTYYREV